MAWRIEQLKAIKAMIEASRGAMREALWHDLRRNETDADLMDIDINIHEAEFTLAHLPDWIKPRREATPIVMEPGHVRVRRDPLVVTLSSARGTSRSCSCSARSCRRSRPGTPRS